MKTSIPPVLRLASASPRRRELLSQIGVPHVVTTADIDETVEPGEAPHDYVMRMAQSKARAIWHVDKTLPVLGADTTVVLNGVIYGKPRDKANAAGMLRSLSARTHEVLTAVALATGAGVAVRLNVSTVRFREILPEEVEAYWETGEPRDKAGAYAVQGYGAVFIDRLKGSYSGVMGLPLFETAGLLRAAQIPCWVGAGS